MYDYNDGMAGSDRKAKREVRKAERRGIYPYEGAQFVPQHHSQPESGNYYNPAQPPNNYAQPYYYQTAASLAHQRAFLISHVASFVLVSVLLVFAWLMSGATYFWPGWIIGLWAIGLLSQAVTYFMRRSID
ncbi:MAG TPA: 2TM domain-containing protein [Chloroflexia bacterium]|nr:2TM domain-containing protein [Chloroflexia bacterium]